MSSDRVGKYKEKNVRSGTPYSRPKGLIRRVTDSILNSTWIPGFLRSENEEQASAPLQLHRNNDNKSSRSNLYPEEGSDGPSSYPLEGGLTGVPQAGPSGVKNCIFSSVESSVTPKPPTFSMPLQNEELNSYSRTEQASKQLVNSNQREVPFLFGEASNHSVLENSAYFRQQTAEEAREISAIRTPNRKQLNASLKGDMLTPSSPSSRLRASLAEQSSSKRPRFSLSAYNSAATPAGDKSVLSDSSFRSSPFYPGRTIYGGAAAYRRTPTPVTPNRSNTSSPRVGASSNNDGGLSAAAQKILSSLNSLSTPISDAKKMPLAGSNQSTGSHLLASSYLESPYTAAFLKHKPAKGSAPPTHFINTPMKVGVESTLSQYILPKHSVMDTSSSSGCEQPSIFSVAAASSTSRTNNLTQEVESILGYVSNLSETIDSLVPDNNLAINEIKRVSNNVDAVKETHMKLLFQLDALESNGVDEIRKERKALVHRVQQSLSEVDVMAEKLKPKLSAKETTSTTANVVSKDGASSVTCTGSETSTLPLVSHSKAPETSTLPLVSQSKASGTSKLPPVSRSKAPETKETPTSVTTTSFGKPSECYYDSSSGGGGKMKSAKSSGRMKSSQMIDYETQPAPPAFASIPSLPRLAFTAPINISNFPVTTNLEAKSKSSGDCFTFSTPKIIDKNEHSTEPAQTCPFQFRPPIDIENKNETSIQKMPSVNFKVPTQSIKPKVKAKTEAEKVQREKEAVSAPQSGDLISFLKKSKPSNDATPQSNWGDLLKNKSSTWECGTCLLQNGSDKSKCVACESLKPGAVASPNVSNPSKVSSDSFSFGVNSSSTTASAIGKPSDPSNSFGSSFTKAAGDWDCEACLLRNKSSSSQCVACQTDKPGFKGTTSKATDSMETDGKTSSSSGTFNFGVKPSESSDASKTKFGNQATESSTRFGSGTFSFGVKPSESNKSQNTKVGIQMTEKSVFGGGSFSFGVTPSESSSKSISQTNDSSSSKFEEKSITSNCIKTPAFSKPSCGGKSAGSITTTSVSSFGGFGDKFKKNPGDWECSECLVSNKSSANSCVSCSTPKPGDSKTSTADKTAPAPQQGFGDMFKMNAGNWECSTCMISNKSGVSKCIACESPREGTVDSSKIVTGNFKFGSSSTTENTFSFGVSNKSANLPAPTSTNSELSFSVPQNNSNSVSASSTNGELFSFGMKSSTVNSQKSMPSFSFSSAATPKSNDSNNEQSQPQLTTFSSMTNSKGDSSFVTPNGVAQEAKKALPVFSFSSTNAEKPVPSFGSTIAMNKPPSFGATIEMNKPPSFGISESKNATFGNTFGNAFTSNSPKKRSLPTESTATNGVPEKTLFGNGDKNPVFGFGSSNPNSTSIDAFANANNNNEPKKDLTFGSMPKPSAGSMFAFGQPPEKKASTGFDFGQASPPSKGFDFAANKTIPTSGFSFGQAPSAPAGPSPFQFGSSENNAMAMPSLAFGGASNPFSTSTPPSGRVIRKAMRRTKK